MNVLESLFCLWCGERSEVRTGLEKGDWSGGEGELGWAVSAGSEEKLARWENEGGRVGRTLELRACWGDVGGSSAALSRRLSQMPVRQWCASWERGRRENPGLASAGDLLRLSHCGRSE